MAPLLGRGVQFRVEPGVGGIPALEKVQNDRFQIRVTFAQSTARKSSICTEHEHGGLGRAPGQLGTLARWLFRSRREFPASRLGPLGKSLGLEPAPLRFRHDLILHKLCGILKVS